ncbi:MAG: peptidase modulator of gyrase [Fibrobacteres bacterium]|nr:peptidase modulator of gyrase [Fibrobacterota bacterium]
MNSFPLHKYLRPVSRSFRSASASAGISLAAFFFLATVGHTQGGQGGSPNLAAKAMGKSEAAPAKIVTETDEGGKTDVRLRFYQDRLKKYLSILQKSDSLKPYFLAYRINDTLFHSFLANSGGVIEDKSGVSRYLGVEARVGSGKFDNTHPMRENLDFTAWDGYQNIRLPYEPEGKPAEQALKVATDFAFRSAKDQFIKIKANVDVRPAEDDTGLDFASAPPVRHSDPPFPLPASRKSLDGLYANIKKASLLFANRPHLYSSQIDFNYRKVKKILVNSDGTALSHTETLGNIGLYVETKAQDGMILWLTKDFFFKEIPLDFPYDSLAQAADLLLRRLDTLRAAPVMETYVGPVILQNIAAAVFTHEVFGHRVEGHRQKAVDEGQTFVTKINQSLAAPFISIMDDPTREFAGGVPLNGYYRYDDEGVAARPTPLMVKGVFRDFLFSRSVISPKGASNGHGRGVLGLSPTARMGNTILEASRTVPAASLRDSLRAILKKSGKPYGLLLHDISGGFTYTGRDLPQSFRVEPLYVSQIFADGRPDKVVRGVDAVGTPLVSLRQVALAGDDPAVFNGYCGAESGWIPVSAVAPSLLLESMEFESRAKDQNMPPILPPPEVRR